MHVNDKTYWHRNILDDFLDGLLAIVAILYFAFGNKIGLSLDDKTLAAIAACGATARVSMRKVLIKLWEVHLGRDALSAPEELVALDADAREDEA